MPCGHAATALPDREARAQIPRPPTNSEFGTEFSEAARVTESQPGHRFLEMCRTESVRCYFRWSSEPVSANETRW